MDMVDSGAGSDPEGERATGETMACYAINVAARLLGARIARDLEPLGLMPGQIPALLALDHCDELTQAELARITRVEQPTMALTLRRMEQDGLIVRNPDERDARRRRIRLTAGARDLLPAMQRARDQVDAQALQGLTPAERRQLDRLVQQLIGNLTDPEPTAEA